MGLSAAFDAPDMRRSLVLDKEDLRNAGAAVLAAVERHGDGHRPLTPERHGDGHQPLTPEGLE
jgi:hypothetical protein